MPGGIPQKSAYRVDIDSLRRPSQFIGLERYYQRLGASPEPASFTNYPILLSPIDMTQPSRVFGNDPKSYISAIGTVAPEDRQVSTVVQFRALDFGMEICELQIITPNTTSINVLLPSGPIELYELKAGPKPLHEATLSWSSRPARGELLELISFHPRMTWRRRFSCLMDELFTFELSCPVTAESKQCNLDWWQAQEHPSPGKLSMCWLLDITWLIILQQL
ncbi:hypothetical protein C8J56DRAFT_786753 [Mycena floridula]|nr:hypothetical protein C8J56DRAFT_786753 [Mycena floridula]